MKSLKIRLPESLAADIESECRRRRIGKSEVVRERLVRGAKSPRNAASSFDAIADLCGCLDFLPADLSRRKKHYLKATGYGQQRSR